MVITTERVHNGFVKVDKLTVPGLPYTPEVVRVSNSVAFLVYNLDTDEFLMTTQNRFPMVTDKNPEGTILEVGAGRFDTKIGVAGLVVKELKEELGVDATEDEILVLNDGNPMALSPGVLTEMQYLAYVGITNDRIDTSKRLYGVAAEGESIIRRFIPLQDFVEGKIPIYDMKTFALIQWFLAN